MGRDPEKTSILLVDDHAIIRMGLRALIDREPDLKVVAEAGDGESALKLVEEFSPEIVVMDISMPNLDGSEATGRISAEHPETKVIALSMHREKHHVTRMLSSGASAYVLKEIAEEEIIPAIRAVLEGQIYLSPSVMGTIVEDYVSQLEKPLSTLTERERDVLKMLAEGQNTKEIAFALEVSVKTAEAHRTNIMNKLNLFTIAELTKFALKHKITSLE
jgi:DNA-binding NarL/FixJ family response regulator